MWNEKIEIACSLCGNVRKGFPQDLARSDWCRVCGIRKYWATKEKVSPEQKKARMKEYYKKNKEKSDEQSTKWREQQRLRVIDLLGNKCTVCNESDPIVLHIDHVLDDGAKERKIFKKGYSGFLAKILNGSLELSKYQLLCCNCNWRKEYFRRKNAIKIKISA